MSKIVKGVTRAVSKVVKGVVNAVKKVAQSKLGKIILTAAAVYFGGAAIAGGFGSTAAGGSFLSGMSAGVSSAATSLSSAWSSVMAGNFSGAASTIGNAWGTAGADAGMAAADAAQLAGQGLSAANAGQIAGVQPVSAPVSPANGPGLVNGAQNAANGSYAPIADAMKTATYVQAGMTGTQMLMNAKAANEAEKEAAAQKQQYNDNVGATWWGDGTTGQAVATTTGAMAPESGLVQGSMNQSYKDYMDRMKARYNPYALPTTI